MNCSEANEIGLGQHGSSHERPCWLGGIGAANDTLSDDELSREHVSGPTVFQDPREPLSRSFVEEPTGSIPSQDRGELRRRTPERVRGVGRHVEVTALRAHARRGFVPPGRSPSIEAASSDE